MADTKANQTKSKNTAKTSDEAKSDKDALSKSPNEIMADIVTEQSDDSGLVRISEHVISAVVRKYTLEVPGVVRFANNNLVSGIAEMIGRKSSESNVVVTLENDAVTISVTLVLEFGVRIPEVAGLVQNVISSKVEEITGKHVSKVDMVIQDMEEVDENNDEAGKSE